MSLQAGVGDFYITDERAPMDLDAEHSIGQLFNQLTTLCLLEKKIPRRDRLPGNARR